MPTGLDANSIFALLASFGLSLSAGVRAYLPFLALGVVSQLEDNKVVDLHIKLLPGFQWISHPLVIAVFALLTLYEISADKIPVVDHINDVVHTAIRPLSGAILFVATSNTLTDNGTVGIIVAALLGAGLAGSTHAVKSAVVRPASTATTAGLANPIVSLFEDVLAVVGVLLSVLAPVVAIIVFLILGTIMYFTIRAIARAISNRRNRRASLVTP